MNAPCSPNPTGMRHLPAPYTAPGMRRPPLTAASSSTGNPVPVTSLPMVTQKLCRLFFRPKISRYLPAHPKKPRALAPPA